MKNKKLVIFSVLAVGGVVATAVLGSWAGWKAAKAIEVKKPIGKLETAKVCAPYAIPVIIASGITIISEAVIFEMGRKEIVALTGTVSYLTLNRRKIEEKVKEAVGEEKWKEIKESLREEQVADDVFKHGGVLDVQETGDGNTLCCFRCDFFNIWFRSDPMKVKMVIDEFDHRWENHEYLGFIEDLLDPLHLKLKPEMERLLYYWGWPASDPGCCPGWDLDCPIYIDMDVVEGYVPGYPEETFLIDLTTPPFECYMEY